MRNRAVLKFRLCIRGRLKDDGGDEHWYSFSHTFPTARALSYEEIVRFVATAALDYPYFTWDEAGLYQSCSCRININECHCRIFADRLLEQFVAPSVAAQLPQDMDSAHRLPRATTPKHGNSQGGQGFCFGWLSNLLFGCGRGLWVQL
ncbi:hypothetical protein AK812_SmicGene18580 [Symbiodinium microadriaticum]|uniref:Uncharacterized protein n=1 Tax=Symbiodinium microadriaticum TaxID=2951 RepID=A0A1Q9DUT2_SYMMI|nr:hypothetical protein AK812_SmicGene18580 [Symbiodinium microadriaticum]